MSSINTNVSAMTALQSLTATNQSLSKTQERISTGLRVNSASDNAAYWSIATTMRADTSALSTVQDALGLGAATIDVAYTAVNKAIDVVTQIRDKLLNAQTGTLDRAKVQEEISNLQAQLSGTAASGSLQGQNWVSVDSSAAGYNATKEILSSISRTGSSVSVQTITVDTSKVVLFDSSATATGILDATRNATTGVVDAAGTFTIATLSVAALTDSSADRAIIDGYIKGATAAINELTAGATTLGSSKSRVELQKSFVSSLVDSLNSGIGQLVDADMNEESTRLQALQVKQQLGIQSLSIANQSSQAILRLFQ